MRDLDKSVVRTRSYLVSLTKRIYLRLLSTIWACLCYTSAGLRNHDQSSFKASALLPSHFMCRVQLK
jgi:hypothetical protein